MAIKPTNYTQIPNDVLEAMPDMSDAELRVMLAICRQTFGWHRDRAKLSISFIAKATGMSGQGVVIGTKKLVERGFVNKSPDGDSNAYEVAVEAPNGVDTPSQRGGQVPLNGVDSPPLNGVDTNKQRVPNKAKETKAVPRFLAPIPLLLMSESHLFIEAWTTWIDDRKARHKPMTARAQELQLKSLEAMGAVRAVAAIEHSIACGYTGVYEPNGKSFASKAAAPAKDWQNEEDDDMEAPPK